MQRWQFSLRALLVFLSAATFVAWIAGGHGLLLAVGILFAAVVWAVVGLPVIIALWVVVLCVQRRAAARNLSPDTSAK